MHDVGAGQREADCEQFVIGEGDRAIAIPITAWATMLIRWHAGWREIADIRVVANAVIIDVVVAGIDKSVTIKIVLLTFIWCPVSVAVTVSV